MQKLFRAVLGMFLVVGFSGFAIAGNPPTTGLGESWPNATDVSASPNWHVYVFVLNGVKYVQVNDLNGNVLGAIGTAGGQFITLPIGKYSQYVSTPQQRAANASAAAGSATTVYQDDSTAITVTPQSDGTTTLIILKQAPCSDPDACSGRAF